MQAIYRGSLFGLGVQELEAVKEDIELYYRQYKFYYAIDAYDLAHFFFPYMDTVEFSEANVKDLAFEGIAYDTFFSRTDNGVIYLMDEYKEELTLVRDLFFDKVRRTYTITQNIDKLTDKLIEWRNEGKGLEELVSTNPELCYLFLAFFKRKGNLKELSFAEFLQKKVYIHSLGTDDEEFNMYTNEVFLRPDNRHFVATIFDQFQKRQETTLVEMQEKERDKYLYNTYKDIVAVAKVLTANKVLCNNEKYNRNVFYYLSSTPSKSRVIFELINKSFGNQLPFNSHFRSGRNVYRNISQAFLFTLLVKDYPEESEMPFKMLELLKSYRLNGFTSEVVPDQDKDKDKGGASQAQPAPVAGEDDSVVKALTKLINKVNANIQNHFLSSLFENYKTTLEQISDGGKEKVEGFVQSILEVFEQVQEEQNKVHEDTAYLRYNVSRHFRVSLLKQALLTNKKNENIMVQVRPGLDIVRLNFHHLPFLLFVYEREAWDKYASFYTAMREISEIVSESMKEIKPMVKFLEGFFIWWRSSAVKERTQELLMSIYIDLLTVRADSGDPDLELNLIGALENRADALTAIINSPYNIDNQEGKNKGENQGLRNEIWYVLIWLYRRCKKFENLERLERQLLAAEIEDMRIFHGFGLAYEAWFYHNGKDAGYKWMLEKSREYLEFAEKGYEDFLIKIPTKFADIRNLVIKCIIGIGNSNCDTCLRLYDIDPDRELIFEARKILSKIKDNSDEWLDIDYDLTPIINHTEAELEYYESKLFLDDNEITMAKMKINYADRRFKRSVYHPSLMNEESKEIGNKIIELKEIIYSRGQ